MKRVELKRIVEFLRIGSTEEKTPFALSGRSTVTDNGTIAKDPKFSTADDDDKNDYKKFSLDDGEENVDGGQMTVLRKLCFFLSLNVGVLYVVVLAWLLPCNPTCTVTQNNWERNFTGIHLTSNLEIVNIPGLPSLAIFGYMNDVGPNLVALATSDGKIFWNTSLDFVPRKVLCQFETAFDANSDAIPDCLMGSHNYLSAFNVTDGNVLWQKDIRNGDIITAMHPTMKHANESYVLYSRGQNLFIVDSQNGSEIIRTVLPCPDPMVVNLKPWFTSNNTTIWCLVCEYGDRVEVWTFGEEELLNHAGRPSGEDLANHMDFALLFSSDSHDGSMEPSSDVSLTPDSLTISWADIVVMVTPSHHLRETWERRLWDLSVTNIAAGHYTDSKVLQVAVAALNEDPNSTLHILDSKNGSTVASAPLGPWKVLSMKKLHGKKGTLDALIIESMLLEDSSQVTINFSDPIPKLPQIYRYSLAKYDGKSISLVNLLESILVHESAINVLDAGEAELFLLKEDPDSNVLIEKLVIDAQTLQKNGCNDNHYIPYTHAISD